MKTRLPPSVTASLALLLVGAPAAWAAEKTSAPDSPASTQEPTSPPRPGRPPFRHPPVERPETETVGFLGVQVAPADPVTRAQLSLPRDTALVVVGIAPGSPAAGTLQEHDVLLQLDDQLLIDVRQLAVLVRNHREGDEVVLTYVRAGRKLTAKLKVGRQDVPKGGMLETPFPSHPGFLPGGPEHRGIGPGPGRRGGMGPSPEPPETPAPSRG